VDQNLIQSPVPVPAISIIVPCFNAAAFIRACSDSVLNQGCDVELIIVDDGSTDESPVIVRQLAMECPGRILFAGQANNGQAAARNLGIRMARGKYLGFLDADDQYAPGFLSRAAAVLDQHPGAVAVQGTVDFIDLHRPVEPWQRQAIESTVPGTLLVRAETIGQTGGFPTDPAFRGKAGGEDAVFRLELPKFGDVIAIDHPALRYRVRPGSHFDFFLDRTALKDGHVTFAQTPPQEAEGGFQAAIYAYRDQVAVRMVDRMTQMIQTEATAGANFDAYQRAFADIPGAISQFQGFALYTLAKRWPVSGVSLLLRGEDMRSVCWLAAGCKAGSAGKLAVPSVHHPHATLGIFGLDDTLESVSAETSSLLRTWNRPIRILCTMYPFGTQARETLLPQMARHGLLIVYGNAPDPQFQLFRTRLAKESPQTSLIFNHPDLIALIPKAVSHLP
jgi:hypothetical protein